MSRVDYRAPEWYMAHTPNLEGEWIEATTATPAISRDLFLARAWILREPCEKLQGFMSVPWCHADPDHVDKLRALLDRCAQEPD